MDPLQLMIDEMLRKAQEERSKEMYTLGKFIEKLKEFPSDWKFYIRTEEGVRYVNNELCSYRGYYQDLAMSSTYNGFKEDVIETVGEMLELAQSAMGRKFTGYKGGEYLMGEDTPLWISNYGECSHITIEDIYSPEEGIVEMTLYTREED